MQIDNPLGLIYSAPDRSVGPSTNNRHSLNPSFQITLANELDLQIKAGPSLDQKLMSFDQETRGKLNFLIIFSIHSLDDHWR